MSIKELPFALTDNPNTEVVSDDWGGVLQIKRKFDGIDSAFDWTETWEFSIDYINLNSRYIEGWVAVNSHHRIPMQLLWN